MTPAKCFAIGAVTLLSSANVNMSVGDSRPELRVIIVRTLCVDGYKMVLTKGAAPEAAPVMFQLLDKNNRPIECKEDRR